MGSCNEVSHDVFRDLPDPFTMEDLSQATGRVEGAGRFPRLVCQETLEAMRWLARSNYEMEFRADRRISERVIFPVSETERAGIEDARFVRFAHDDRSHTYYATYTAYNGFQILPMLIETKDFVEFNIITLNGRAVQNKGMALFPRKINGRFAMISRQDGENIHIMFSDHLHFWQNARVLRRPEMPWELVQIGNCGSPVETEAGWLLLTHGVGPMREYCIGVDLLDRNDPTKVIGRLREPLLAPAEGEREGYVPNVVYTCGCLIHNDELIIPYGLSDTECAIASVSVPELLARIKSV